MKKIIPANKAPEVLFDWLFGFIERCDDIRSDAPSTGNLPQQFFSALEKVLDSSPPSINLRTTDDSETDRILQDDIDEAGAGFLDASDPNRTWSSVCDVHSCCWISLIPGFSLAFKDALAEIDKATFKQEWKKKPKYGVTNTRNLNWGKKNAGKRGRPKKADPNAGKPKRPPGRPVRGGSPHNQRKQGNPIPQRQKWRKNSAKYRAKKRGRK